MLAVEYDQAQPKLATGLGHPTKMSHLTRIGQPSEPGPPAPEMD